MTLAATLSFAALLGVNVRYPLVSHQNTGTNAVTYVTYTSVNYLFSVTSPPSSVQFSSSETPRPITGTKSLTINILVDNAGNLIGGVPANGGNDFTLSGTVTRGTNTYSGVLLTGTVTAFGFYGSGASSQYDLRFTATGGALFGFFSCGDIGVTVASPLSTFTGSFSTNFHGSSKGVVGLEDLTPPVVTCPSNITVECNTNNLSQRGAYVAFPNPVGTDNCDTNLTFVYTPPSGSFFALATPGPDSTNYVVTLTAKDAWGNQSSCAFTVTVEDTLAPQFDNDSPIIGECGAQPLLLTNDAGQCYATFTFTTPTASNLCCLAVHSVTNSAVDENGDVIILSDNGNGTETGHFPVTCVGSNVITIVAADDHGNSTNRVCLVYVVDNEPPVITCASNQTVECTGGPINFEEPTAYDNCPNLTISCMPTNGSVLGIGTHQIVYTASDCSGNTNQCTFDVIVQDRTPPTISCPSNVTVECGQSTGPNNTGTATATDTCDANPTVTFTDVVSGSCPQTTTRTCCPQTITRTWKATDASSNSVTCVQTITIQDTTPPVISCPPDKQLQCGDSTDPSNTGMATATDTCSTTVTISYTDAAGLANCTGKPGIDRTWKATDACGNSSTCVQHITYVDTTAPTVTVPAGSNLGCNPATPPTDASLKALVTATDNCGVPTINVSHVDANSGCVVTRTFTVTATDACGNTSATQTVVYSWSSDQTPPTLSGCTNQVVYQQQTVTNGQCHITDIFNCKPISKGNWIWFNSTLNPCTGTNKTYTVNITGQTITGTIGGSNVSLTVPDAQITYSSTTTNATTTFTNGVWVTTCPLASTLAGAQHGSALAYQLPFNSSGLGSLTWSANFAVTPGVSVGWNWAASVYTNFSANYTALGIKSVDDSKACGYKNSDAACTPENFKQYCVFGARCGTYSNYCGNRTFPWVCNRGTTTVCSGGVVQYAPPTATDNCGGVPSVVCVPLPGVDFIAGSTNVTCTATDDCGNTSSCSFTVTLQAPLPTITCPGNITTNTTATSCFIFPPWIFPFIPGNITTNTTATSCSQVVKWTATGTSACGGSVTTICTPASGSTFAIGTTPVTCSAIETGHGTNSCSFTVTVNDTTKPTITCPADITTNTCNSTAVVTFTPTVSDNCSGVTSSCTPASGTAFTQGTNTVTCTATDASGNTASASFKVIVATDTTKPTITCPANITTNTCASSAVVTFTPTVSDNCSGVTYNCTPASGTAFAQGTNTVTCTATDASGNTASASFKVIVTCTKPGCPGSPKCTAGTGKCTLTWTACSSGSAPITYNVLRSTVSGGSYSSIATGITSLTYTDSGLTRGKTYYYVFSAANCAGTSANSAQAYATAQ
jgi:hypothetical protein